MRRVYLTIFLVSCSVLMFEVSLVRLFSIYLWYHFAFMVISIAMLGIGSAGTVLAIKRSYLHDKDIKDRNSTTDEVFSDSNIAVYAMLAGISIIFSYVASNYIPFDPVKLSWEKTQILYVALYCFVLSIPFFFSGILIATAFMLFSKKSELIYSSDLVGAGIGSLTVIAILNIAGPEYAVLSASIPCFIGAILAGKRKVKLLSIIFIMINLMIFVVHPDFIDVRISPYKALSLSLKYPGAEHLKTYHSSHSRIDTFRSPAVRFAPGLSLKYQDPLPEQIGLSIDGDRIDAVTEAKDISKLRFLEFLPSAVIYVIGKTDNVLVLEPKGGLHVLLADYYGAQEIHKIESNPMLVKVIRDDFGNFSGGIFERNTLSGFGRNYLQGSRFYNIIDLPMTGTSVTGIFGISEDYRFTVEAFKKYLNALEKDGIIGISLYLLPPPRTGFRILTTIISALEETGAEDVSEHFAAIRSWDTITILVKNSPFTQQETEDLKGFSKSRRFDLVYYPGIREEESNLYVKLPSNEYFKGFKSLLNPQTSSLFIKNYLFDIKPVYDENPFFRYHLKLKNIKVIYEVMGQKWLYFLEEGYLLPVIFAIVLILTLIMILLPVFLKSFSKTSSNTQLKRFKLSPVIPTLFYFAMLGLGFMFVEVTLIQKSILLLENPAYTVAVVLTAILVSSGIGSMASSRFSALRNPYSLLILAFLVFVYSLIHPLLLNFLSSYALKLKIPVIFVAMMPLGFFMGIPFPMGIKLIGQKDETLIPWAWATNACLSVLAPILTIMFAITIGYKAVLWLGALAYMLAFISLRKLKTK